MAQKEREASLLDAPLEYLVDNEENEDKFVDQMLSQEEHELEELACMALNQRDMLASTAKRDYSDSDFGDDEYDDIFMNIAKEEKHGAFVGRENAAFAGGCSAGIDIEMS